MKPIDILQINSYSKFVTRGTMEAKFVSHQPQASENTRLIFMVGGNIILTDESGKCHSVNGYDSSYLETNFKNFDVFVDDIQIGWINILRTEGEGDVISSCSGKIYNSFQTAKKYFDENCLKTVKIEWVIEDE